MSHSLALVPQIILKSNNTVIHNSLAVVGGAIAISALAQVAIPLPFTPVPITGQTFGVMLISLLLGRKHALATLGLYLTLGATGLPVFAQAQFGLAWGPTLGYLIGMLAASYVVGSLADRGWAKNFLSAWAAASVGSLLVFTFGAIVLSTFVPVEQVFALGVLPFLPGDVIKNTLAAWIVSRKKGV